MKNFLQRGETVTIPAPAITKSGECVVVGKLAGIAAGDADQGAPLDLTTAGVFELPKVSAQAFALGDPVYFASGTKLATSTANGGANARIGVAIKAAGNPSATVEVRLDGAVV